MQKDDITKYPKFARYVSIEVPKVAKIDVIINSIKKFSGTIDKKKITDALIWGQGPMIKITDLKDAFGEFTPNSSSNEIRVQTKMIKEFEAGKGLRRTVTGQLVYLAGVTLLHELTHWADDQDGVDTAGEEGEHFEKAIYGKVIF
jgi:hypothetical protein